DCQFGGSISGSGGLTFIAQNNWTGSDPMEVPFALNASNCFTGPVEIQRGSVYLGNANALAQSNAATLTVTQNHDSTFGGTLTDVYREYPGSGSGTTGPLNLLKTGPALLRLTGISAYAGTTTVAAGALEVDGQLNTGSVTVQGGGTLTGVGELDGPVSVASGGRLAPGAGGLGQMTIKNSLSLAGTAIMELSKTGANLSNDRAVGITTLAYGGSLLATNLGP